MAKIAVKLQKTHINIDTSQAALQVIDVLPMGRSITHLILSIARKPSTTNKFGYLNASSGHRFAQIAHKHKSTSGRKPKQRIYHRVPELDRVMELQKKPTLILNLVSIVQSRKNGFLLLRDLEKEVGFVEKWNCMAAIERYPTIFRVIGGHGEKMPPAVRLTEAAKKMTALEPEARFQMVPILVTNLQKLLMLSVECRLPLQTIELLADELGLPVDFKDSIILKHPQFFKLNRFNEREYLCLENWNSSLAITAREAKLASPTTVPLYGQAHRAKLPRDGNFSGPSAFRLDYPPGFRPNTSYLEEVVRWQKLDFPSPYLNARRFEWADPKTRKRAVALLHELLSLTVEKRLTSGQLEAFHGECRLPARLLLCLIRHHGMFYVTNKGVRSTVFLKEAYEGSSLVDKCPLVEFRDRFMALIGRKD